MTCTNQNIIEIGTISLYPNPFSNQITVESVDVITEITLCSIDGKLINHWYINNEIQTPIKLPTSMTRGIYLINVQTKKGSTNFKVIND